MPNILRSLILAPHNSFAANFNSIVGANSKRLRKVQPAKHNAQYGTMCLELLPRIACPITEVAAAIKDMQRVLRSIINCDLRYQQRLGNLPAFKAMRNICVRHSVFDDEIVCYPFVRIFCDNAQVVAFIVSRWAIRTGLLPKVVSVINRDGECYDDVYYKSNPLALELMLRDSNVEALRFGAAAAINKSVTDEDYTRDIYPIAGVAISRPFGNPISVYARRRVRNSYIDAHLSDFIDEVLSIDETKFAKQWRLGYWLRHRVKRIHRSYYGSYRYANARYSSARDNCVANLESATFDAALYASKQSLKGCESFMADHSVLSRNFKLLRNLVLRLRFERDEARRKVWRLRSAANDVDTNCHVEVEAGPYNKRQLSQNIRNCRAAAIAAFNATASPVYPFVKPFDVEVSIAKLRELFPVEVNNGVATIQLRR